MYYQLSSLTDQQSIDVFFAYSDPILRLSYPTLQEQYLSTLPVREDYLWEQQECYELFIAQTNDSTQEYFEFNFTPDKKWNCFHFTAYRQNKQELYENCIISINQSNQRLDIELQWEHPINFIQLAAIRRSDKKCQYFALQHTKGKADFHCRDKFITLN